MEKERKDIEKDWADWLESSATEDTSSQVPPMDDADLSELNRLAQDCNRVFAREKYPEPNTDKAWARFEEKHIVSRRKHLRMFLWGGIIGAAACMVLVWLFSWAGTDKEEDIFQPMTVFTAARESRGVTLSGDDGTMWELDNGQAEVALSQRGIQVDEQVVDYRKTVSVEKQTLTIPRGRNFYVLLSDGTEVWLNAESRLSYPSRFDEDERIVELEGEAYFKVASDKAHPFIVRTSRFNTRVLGTEFNVKAHQDDTPYVTLVSGSVRIKASRSGEEVSLHPGQEFSINAEDKIELKEVDPYYCTQWKNGFFYFDRASLEEILYELGRWYNVDIELDCDRSVLDYHMHYVADKQENISESLAKLNALQKVKVTYENNKITVK